MEDLRRRLKDLLQSEGEPVASLERGDLVIYGAGSCGHAVAAHAGNAGIKVCAFLDTRADRSFAGNGIPCYSPDGAEAPALAREGVPIVIAIFNYAYSQANQGNNTKRVQLRLSYNF